VSDNLFMAEILHTNQYDPDQIMSTDRMGSPSDLEITKENWSIERFEYGYRTSKIKRSQSIEKDTILCHEQPCFIVLSAQFRLELSTPELIQAKMEKFLSYRRRNQPPGASMGSIFKNPPGDFACRLIEAAGLKGTRIGNAQISPMHANFFVNLGNASAADIYALIQLTRQTVVDKFSIKLELEIGLFGDWQ
jgi:UDP-N-acetylmuramate dehydrogenase